MEEKVVIGGFQTDAGGIFAAEWRAFIGELVLAVFAAEGGHDITAPPAEQTAGHTQFAAGEELSAWRAKTAEKESTTAAGFV